MERELHNGRALEGATTAREDVGVGMMFIFAVLEPVHHVSIRGVHKSSIACVPVLSKTLT